MQRPNERMSWLPKRCVVVPFDFSEPSCSAVAAGLQLADKPCHVEVVYVIQSPHPGEPYVLWGKETERIERSRAALEERLAKEQLQGVTVHVRSGNPGEEIVALANELGAELIVIPSHGKHRIQRILLGSVTERVLRLANCPVLVLPRGDK